MADLWSVAVGGLVAIASSVVTSALQSKYQFALEREKRVLEKIEQLYRGLASVERLANTALNRFLEQARGEYFPTRDELGQWRSTVDELKMLVGLYAPNVAPAVDEITKRFVTIDLIAQNHAASPFSEESLRELAGEVQTSCSTIITTSRETRAAVITAAGKFRLTRGSLPGSTGDGAR